MFQSNHLTLRSSVFDSEPFRNEIEISPHHSRHRQSLPVARISNNSNELGCDSVDYRRFSSSSASGMQSSSNYMNPIGIDTRPPQEMSATIHRQLPSIEKILNNHSNHHQQNKIDPNSSNGNGNNHNSNDNDSQQQYLMSPRKSIIHFNANKHFEPFWNKNSIINNDCIIGIDGGQNEIQTTQFNPNQSPHQHQHHHLHHHHNSSHHHQQDYFDEENHHRFDQIVNNHSSSSSSIIPKRSSSSSSSSVSATSASQKKNQYLLNNINNRQFDHLQQQLQQQHHQNHRQTFESKSLPIEAMFGQQYRQQKTLKNSPQLLSSSSVSSTSQPFIANSSMELLDSSRTKPLWNFNTLDQTIETSKWLKYFDEKQRILFATYQNDYLQRAITLETFIDAIIELFDQTDPIETNQTNPQKYSLIFEHLEQVIRPEDEQKFRDYFQRATQQSKTFQQIIDENFLPKDQNDEFYRRNSTTLSKSKPIVGNQIDQGDDQHPDRSDYYRPSSQHSSIRKESIVRNSDMKLMQRNFRAFFDDGRPMKRCDNDRRVIMSRRHSSGPTSGMHLNHHQIDHFNNGPIPNVDGDDDGGDRFNVLEDLNQFQDQRGKRSWANGMIGFRQSSSPMLLSHQQDHYHRDRRSSTFVPISLMNDRRRSVPISIMNSSNNNARKSPSPSMIGTTTMNAHFSSSPSSNSSSATATKQSSAISTNHNHQVNIDPNRIHQSYSRNNRNNSIASATAISSSLASSTNVDQIQDLLSNEIGNEQRFAYHHHQPYHHHQQQHQQKDQSISSILRFRQHQTTIGSDPICSLSSNSSLTATTTMTTTSTSSPRKGTFCLNPNIKNTHNNNAGNFNMKMQTRNGNENLMMESDDPSVLLTIDNNNDDDDINDIHGGGDQDHNDRIVDETNIEPFDHLHNRIPKTDANLMEPIDGGGARNKNRKNSNQTMEMMMMMKTMDNDQYGHNVFINNDDDRDLLRNGVDIDGDRNDNLINKLDRNNFNDDDDDYDEEEEVEPGDDDDGVDGGGDDDEDDDDDEKKDDDFLFENHTPVRRHRSLPAPTLFPSSPLALLLNGRLNNRQKLQRRSCSFKYKLNHSTVIQEPNGHWRIRVKKIRSYLGIAIEGGSNVSSLSQPRIINIQDGGAAADNLQVGHIILEVDGQSTNQMNHAQVAQMIAKAYYNTPQKDYVEFVVREKSRNEFDLRRSSFMLLNSSFE